MYFFFPYFFFVIDVQIGVIREAFVRILKMEDSAIVSWDSQETTAQKVRREVNRKKMHEKMNKQMKRIK